MTQTLLEQTVPTEVVDAFHQDGISSVEVLTGGRFNMTLLVYNHLGELSILQRMGARLEPGSTKDYLVVADHLRGDNWEVAKLLPTGEGDVFSTDDSGRHWRSFEYLPSDGQPPTPNLAANIAVSSLLGKLHTSLSSLEFQPEFGLPHFHDTPYIAEEMERQRSTLDNPADRELAGRLIDAAQTHALAEDQPPQLIHGDPKLANVLYRMDNPFTFVDFDDAMVGNPLVDLGDFIRSATSKMVDGSDRITAETIAPIIDTYRTTTNSKVSPEAFYKHAVNAARLISVELGMRYLTDSVESDDTAYFKLDTTAYESRAQQNTHRARLQWETYRALGTIA